MKNVVASFLRVSNQHVEAAVRALKDFKGDANQLTKLQGVVEGLRQAQLALANASSQFYGLRFSKLTPDGKLGGRGYTAEVSTIRDNMTEAQRMIMTCVQSLDDEFENPHWKAAIAELTKTQQQKSVEQPPEQKSEEMPRKAKFSL